MLPIVIGIIVILIAGYYIYTEMNNPWKRSANINLMDTNSQNASKINSSQRLIGTFATEAECANACLPLTWCNYYTYFGESTDKPNQCWGLVNTSNKVEQNGVFSGERKEKN